MYVTTLTREGRKSHPLLLSSKGVTVKDTLDKFMEVLCSASQTADFAHLLSALAKLLLSCGESLSVANSLAAAGNPGPWHERSCSSKSKLEAATSNRLLQIYSYRWNPSQADLQGFKARADQSNNVPKISEVVLGSLLRASY